MKFPSVSAWLTVAGAIVLALTACDRGQKARIDEKDIAKMECQRGFDSKEFVAARNDSLRLYPVQQQVVRTTVTKWVTDEGLSDEAIEAFQVIKAQTISEHATSGLDLSVEKNCDTMTARFSTGISNELNPFSEILTENEFTIQDLTTNSITLEGQGLQIVISDLTEDNSKLAGPGAATMSLAIKRTNGAADLPREVVIVQNTGFSHPEAEVALDASVEMILNQKYGPQNVDFAKIQSQTVSSDGLQKTGTSEQVKGGSRFSESRLIQLVLMAGEI